MNATLEKVLGLKVNAVGAVVAVALAGGLGSAYAVAQGGRILDEPVVTVAQQQKETQVNKTTQMPEEVEAPAAEKEPTAEAKVPEKKATAGKSANGSAGRGKNDASAQGTASTVEKGQDVPQSPAKSGQVTVGDDVYKQENGSVYEWDDGRWEYEDDKKIENGVVYEYDNGAWQQDDDYFDTDTSDWDDDDGDDWDDDDFDDDDDWDDDDD